MYDIYKVCSKNTRTKVIKMYFIWKLHTSDDAKAKHVSQVQED